MHRCSAALLVISCALLVLPPLASRAETYKCTSRDGAVEFSDRPCPADRRTPTTKPTATDATPGRANALTNTAIAGLPLEDRLKSCQTPIAIAAALEVLNGLQAAKEPAEGYTAALVLLENGRRDDAVFWFYATQLRARQQLVVQQGNDRGQIFAIMQGVIGPLVNGVALQDTSRLVRTLDDVIAWDRRTPNPYSTQARDAGKQAQFDAVTAGLETYKAKLRTDRSTIESAARAQAQATEQALESMKRSRCVAGRPDPAFERRIAADEKARVEQFVASDPRIARAAGGQVRVRIGSSTSFSAEPDRGQYDVSVDGSTSMYAIVEVDRRGGSPKLRLACVTSLNPGARDAHKDVCSYAALPLGAH